MHSTIYYIIIYALGDKKTFSFGQYDRYEGNVEHFTGGSSEHCDGRSRRADVQVRPSWERARERGGEGEGERDPQGRRTSPSVLFARAHGHTREGARVRADGHWQRRDEGALREGETEVRILSERGYG